MRSGDQYGWTCEHVGNTSGPCAKCAPASGLCTGCGYPLDDHLVVGKEPPVCRKKRRAAA